MDALERTLEQKVRGCRPWLPPGLAAGPLLLPGTACTMAPASWLPTEVSIGCQPRVWLPSCLPGKWSLPGHASPDGCAGCAAFRRSLNLPERLFLGWKLQLIKTRFEGLP